MSRAIRVNQPNVLQDSHLKFKNEQVREQTIHTGVSTKSVKLVLSHLLESGVSTNQTIQRVVIHHNKDIPLPTRRSHTSWANKVHMEQLAWMLSHHTSERRVRRDYHLGMPTRRTKQLFLKPQPWQSSNQIEFTPARHKVKVQVTQLPVPLPQLTRRTSQETPLYTRRLRKISSEHLTLGNNHANKVPLRIQNLRTTRPKQ
jgi:hypothetical protein